MDMSTIMTNPAAADAWASYIESTQAARETLDAAYKAIKAVQENEQANAQADCKALVHEAWERACDANTDAWRAYMAATATERQWRDERIAKALGQVMIP